jgi:transposase
MDETRVQVLREAGRRAESQSYMWIRARPDPDDPIVLFDYDPSRSGAVPKRLLEGFTGRLQVDGYDGYAEVCRRDGMIRHGCMAHARRKLFDASKSSKKPGIANKGLKYVQRLYKIEELCRGWTPERRYTLRQERARPILGDLRSFIADTIGTVPESGLTGKALHYANNEWMYLERYIDDGRVEIDNNFVENQIRPFAVGRKNWLFSATVDGANASANIYTLITTAKLHGLDVYRYLRYVFERLPAARTLADLELLLPAAVAIEFARQDGTR